MSTRAKIFLPLSIIAVIAVVIVVIINSSKDNDNDFNSNTEDVVDGTGKVYINYDDYTQYDDDTEYKISYTSGNYWVEGIKRYSPSIEFPTEYDGNKITGVLGESFENNDKLEDIILPYGYYIQLGAFAGSSVKSLTVSDYCTLSMSSFENCTQLEEVIYTGISETLEANVFNGCTYLKTVQLSEGMTYIEVGAFANCSSLTEIQLPMSLEDLHEDAFKNTPLQKIIGYSGSVAETFANEHGIMFESLD